MFELSGCDSAFNQYRREQHYRDYEIPIVVARILASRETYIPPNHMEALLCWIACSCGTFNIYNDTEDWGTIVVVKQHWPILKTEWVTEAILLWPYIDEFNILSIKVEEFKGFNSPDFAELGARIKELAKSLPHRP